MRLTLSSHYFHYHNTIRKSDTEASNIIPFDQSEKVSRTPANFMNSQLLTQAAEIIEDPQILVNVISKRVAQLNQGRAPLIDTVPSMGAADIALTEVIEGKVIISKPEAE